MSFEWRIWALAITASLCAHAGFLGLFFSGQEDAATIAGGQPVEIAVLGDAFADSIMAGDPSEAEQSPIPEEIVPEIEREVTPPTETPVIENDPVPAEPLSTPVETAQEVEQEVAPPDTPEESSPPVPDLAQETKSEAESQPESTDIAAEPPASASVLPQPSAQEPAVVQETEASVVPAEIIPTSENAALVEETEIPDLAPIETIVALTTSIPIPTVRPETVEEILPKPSPKVTVKPKPRAKPKPVVKKPRPKKPKKSRAAKPVKKKQPSAKQRAQKRAKAQALAKALERAKKQRAVKKARALAKKKKARGNKGKSKRNTRRGVETGKKKRAAKRGGKSNRRAKAAGNGSISNYRGKLRRKINRRFRPGRIRGAKRDVVVRFVVSKSGRVKSVAISRSSGSGKLDAAAIRAVRSSSPFPPLPGGRSSLTVTVPMNVRG